MAVNGKLLNVENTKPVTFPVLMRWRPTGEIILFVSPEEGTVVVEGKGHNVGYHSKSFNNIHTDKGWERIADGVSVVLTNEAD